MRTELIEQLAALVPAGPARVTVDRVDGTGKTVLAAALRRRARPVVRVSIDGFHNPRELRYRLVTTTARSSSSCSSRSPRAEAGSTCPRSTTRAPTGPRRRRCPDDAALVVGGIFLHRDELVGRWDFSLRLEVPFEISIPRGARRGSGHPGPSHPSNRCYVGGSVSTSASATPRGGRASWSTTRISPRRSCGVRRVAPCSPERSPPP